jgi:hypothetical protein
MAILEVHYARNGDVAHRVAASVAQTFDARSSSTVVRGGSVCRRSYPMCTRYVAL